MCVMNVVQHKQAYLLHVGFSRAGHVSAEWLVIKVGEIANRKTAITLQPVGQITCGLLEVEAMGHPV